MSITLEQAKQLTHGTILYHRSARNADGSPQRWRVSGKVKTWKRSPARVEVPLKHGLYWHRHLTEGDLVSFCLTEDEVPPPEMVADTNGILRPNVFGLIPGRSSV